MGGLANVDRVEVDFGYTSREPRKTKLKQLQGKEKG